MRLNQYIARHTGLSRRQADDAITTDRVLVNDLPAALGMIVTESDHITIDHQPVLAQKLIYLALNKPVGYISSRRAQGNSPTLYSLLPRQYHHLKSVGRLDKDSSGLIILTNDGNFAQTSTHPKFSKLKRYVVELDRPLQPHDLEQFNTGIELEDGISKLHISRSGHHYLIALKEGRNRQIRRTFASQGYSVTTLNRTHFGKLGLNGLEPGQYRLISPHEVL